MKLWKQWAATVLLCAIAYLFGGWIPALFGWGWGWMSVIVTAWVVWGVIAVSPGKADTTEVYVYTGETNEIFTNGEIVKGVPLTKGRAFVRRDGANVFDDVLFDKLFDRVFP